MDLYDNTRSLSSCARQDFVWQQSIRVTAQSADMAGQQHDDDDDDARTISAKQMQSQSEIQTDTSAVESGVSTLSTISDFFFLAVRDFFDFFGFANPLPVPASSMKVS